MTRQQARKHNHVAQRVLAVLSIALTLAVSAPTLARAEAPQEDPVAPSEMAAGDEGPTEESELQAEESEQTDCEANTLDLSEGTETKDAAVQASELAEIECDLAASPSTELAESSEAESEPLSEEDPEVSVAFAPITTVDDFVANAYSVIGAGYQWSGYNWTGSASSSAFNAAGIVDFARGYPSRSSSPESLYAEVVAIANLVNDASQLNYGDLVFYEYGGRSPGHVGIYIGGGLIIDSIPNGGVAIRDMDYMSESFMGGGPLFDSIPSGQPDEDTPPSADNDKDETDGTPAPSEPTPAPTPASSSSASSHALLPETGDPTASLITTALAASGLCALLAGRIIRS